MVRGRGPRYTHHGAGLLALVLALVACGGERAAAGGPQGKVIGGDIEDWTAEGLLLQAVVVGDKGFDDYIVLGTSAITRDGSFSLSLPSGVGIRDALATVTAKDYCDVKYGDVTNTIEVTPSQFYGAAANFRVYPPCRPRAIT